jgi:hypothetical protein
MKTAAFSRQDLEQKPGSVEFNVFILSNNVGLLNYKTKYYEYFVVVAVLRSTESPTGNFG